MVRLVIVLSLFCLPVLALAGLEIPAATPDVPVYFCKGFAFEYSEEHELARWVAYRLEGFRPKVTGRTNDFRPDPAIETGSAELGDYRGSGYDRGHQAPAADFRHCRRVLNGPNRLSSPSADPAPRCPVTTECFALPSSFP